MLHMIDSANMTTIAPDNFCMFLNLTGIHHWRILLRELPMSTKQLSFRDASSEDVPIFHPIGNSPTLPRVGVQ